MHTVPRVLPFDRLADADRDLAPVEARSHIAHLHYHRGFVSSNRRALVHVARIAVESTLAISKKRLVLGENARRSIRSRAWERISTRRPDKREVCPPAPVWAAPDGIE